jgi:hypothetical protein
MPCSGEAVISLANSKDQLADDVAFIFAECARLNEMVNGGRIREIPREDAWCDIPHPSHQWPNGKMMCSRAGFDRLDRLTKLALRRANIDRLVSTEPARKALAEILVRKFVREERPIEIKQIERAMSEAAKRSDSTRADLTHFIPCHLMLSQQPSTFQIGPIRFLNRATFRKALADHIRANRANDVVRNRRIIFDAVRYFKTFGWVAEVTVVGCDDETSKTTATNAVTSSLNCLHVLFGAGHSRKMMVGGPAIGRDKRGGFTVAPNGTLSFMASYGGPGEVGFNDDWLGLFADTEAQTAIANLGVTLEAVVDPSLRRPISERFVDAAQWFGEAVREPSPAAKAIKYVTALERMVMTDEKDDIAGLVSARVAALCLEEPTAENLEKWRGNAKRAYGVRSKLVHGSLSPTSEQVFEGVRLGAELGRATLLGALSTIGPDGLRNEAVSNKQLGRWYDGLVAHADRVIENMSQSF